MILSHEMLQERTPPDARILKIREYEDRLAQIQNAVKVSDKTVPHSTMAAVVITGR